MKARLAGGLKQQNTAHRSSHFFTSGNHKTTRPQDHVFELYSYLPIPARESIAHPLPQRIDTIRDVAGMYRIGEKRHDHIFSLAQPVKSNSRHNRYPTGLLALRRRLSGRPAPHSIARGKNNSAKCRKKRPRQEGMMGGESLFTIIERWIFASQGGSRMPSWKACPGGT